MPLRRGRPARRAPHRPSSRAGARPRWTGCDWRGGGRRVRGVVEGLDAGEFEQAFIKCSEGTILAAEAGSDAILIALYERDADLSLSGLRIKATTRAIDETLAKA